MITKGEAIKLVEKQLRKIEFGDNYRIDQQNTEEHDWGWVIYYNTERFLETQEIQFSLMGNSPFLVYRESGRVETLSSAEQTDIDIGSWLKPEDN